MKLAFTTLACPGWTLEQAAEAARAAGYEGLELRLLDGEVVGPELSIGGRKRVRDVLAANGLALVCLDTSVRIAQPDAAARDKQLHDGLLMLEMAAELGAPMIRVFAGPPEGTSDDAAVAAAVATLIPLADKARLLGVAVALETHDAFCSSETVSRVLAETTPEATGALWDLLHPYRIGERPEQTLARLRDRLLHVHIKDGRPKPEGGPNWDLTLLGKGAVPTRDILAALRTAGYDGWLAVEWEKKWHPTLAEPEVALPQHAEKLREYLQ
jgi:sugar phosphate isomerase/epimerase